MNQEIIQDCQIEENVLVAEIVNNPFDAAQILSASKPQHNSHFLQSIERHFSIEMQMKASTMFDIIIKLRYGELIAESTYARISTEVISQALSLFWEQLSAESLELITEIKRFSSSLYLQKIYLKSLGGLIEPIEIKLDHNISYQYVSIHAIVDLLLNNKSLVKSIIQEQSSDFGYSDYLSELTCDYQRWQRIKGKLRLQLYSDEFCIVNPIGHSKYEQNYLVIYCTCTNIPYRERLKRSDLFLLLIINYKHVNEQFLDQVLNKLNQDIELLLSNGITKQMSNGTITIPCTLSSFVGDSKSAYLFLGFPDTFYLGFRCRICGATYTEIQDGILNKTCFGSAVDIEEYWRLVNNAEGIYLPHDDLVRELFGLVRTFKFASVESQIDPWWISPTDVCHDLLEGAIPKLISFILALLTKLFLKNKDQMVLIITTKQFYDAPFAIRSVPGGFSIDGDMIQKAELFIRLEQILLDDLPTIAGVSAQLIYESLPFQLYLSLKSVSIISFQTIISNNDLEILTTEIKSMFLILKSLDPSFPITPKMHHITHYPSLIIKFGPLVQFSSLPFER